MFAAWLREQLGTAGIHRHFHRLERAMSQLSDQLNQANDTLTGLQADVQILLDRANVPAEDVEAQAAADRLTAFASGWRASTPDADGSDQPAEPTEPQQG